MSGRTEGGAPGHDTQFIDRSARRPVRRTRWLAIALVLLAATAGPAFAVNPDEVLADPVLETRARAISAELRCMVCQNQSIDDSNAELAKDLRLLVRDLIKAGDSDQQVMDYIVSRYGEFVLLKPPVAFNTVLLWGMPVLLLLVGGVVISRQVARRRQLQPVAPLSEDEQKALDAILGDQGSK